VRERDTQDGGLDLVQARVVANLLVREPVGRAVEPQSPDPVGKLCIRGGDGPAVPHRSEVLGREEGEGGDRPQSAGATGRPGRSSCLGRVLHHRHSQGLDLRDRGHVAEQVHGDDSARTRGERGPDAVRRHAEGLRVHIAEDGSGAGGRDGLGGGVEREGRHHHLVARADAQCAQRDGQCFGPVGHAHRVIASDVGGELPLERLDLGPQDEAAAVEHRRNAGIELGTQPVQRG
jgi:hypothetical protein